jgi:hypothetical protein
VRARRCSKVSKLYNGFLLNRRFEAASRLVFATSTPHHFPKRPTRPPHSQALPGAELSCRRRP